MSHALRRLTTDQYRDWLLHHGVGAPEVQNVLSGFDPLKPLTEEVFEPGERLFQYMRGSSFWDRSVGSGSWFALAGASPTGLSILEGPAGRLLHRFVVVAVFQAIEGTARALPPNHFTGIGGGQGGASQVFVPRMYQGCIRAVGPQERW